MYTYCTFKQLRKLKIVIDRTLKNNKLGIDV